MGLSFFKDANAIIFFSDLIGYCKVHWKSCFYFGVTSNILNTLNLEMGCMNPTHTSSMDLVKMLTRKHQFQKCKSLLRLPRLKDDRCPITKGSVNGN